MEAYMSLKRSSGYMSLACHNKERVTYKQLSPVQWMSGYFSIMRDNSDLNIRSNILEYAISSLDDAQDFSWPSAKASHAVLLCSMEQCETGTWSETEKIDKIHRTHAQRHAQNNSNIKNQVVQKWFKV